MGNLIYAWPLIIIPIVVYGSELVHRIKKAMHMLDQEEIARKIKWMESALRSPEGAWAAAPMMTKWFDWYPDELDRNDEWWTEFSPNLVGNWEIIPRAGGNETSWMGGQKALDSVSMMNIETINEQRKRILYQNERIEVDRKRQAEYLSAGPGGGMVTPRPGITQEQQDALHYQFPKLGCQCAGCVKRHDEFMANMVCDYRKARDTPLDPDWGPC